MLGRQGLRRSADLAIEGTELLHMRLFKHGQMIAGGVDQLRLWRDTAPAQTGGNTLGRVSMLQCRAVDGQRSGIVLRLIAGDCQINRRLMRRDGAGLSDACMLKAP